MSALMFTNVLEIKAPLVTLNNYEGRPLILLGIELLLNLKSEVLEQWDSEQSVFVLSSESTGLLLLSPAGMVTLAGRRQRIQRLACILKMC